MGLYENLPRVFFFFFLGGGVVQIVVHRKIHTKTRIFCITRLKLRSVERNNSPQCEAVGNNISAEVAGFIPQSLELRSVVVFDRIRSLIECSFNRIMQEIRVLYVFFCGHPFASFACISEKNNI